MGVVGDSRASRARSRGRSRWLTGSPLARSTARGCRYPRPRPWVDVRFWQRSGGRVVAAPTRRGPNVRGALLLVAALLTVTTLSGCGGGEPSQAETGTDS